MKFEELCDKTQKKLVDKFIEAKNEELIRSTALFLQRAAEPVNYLYRTFSKNTHKEEQCFNAILELLEDLFLSHSRYRFGDFEEFLKEYNVEFQNTREGYTK